MNVWRSSPAWADLYHTQGYLGCWYIIQALYASYFLMNGSPNVERVVAVMSTRPWADTSSVNIHMLSV